MTIDEAIKLIQKDIDDNYFEEGSPLETATQLGIEALRAVQFWNHKQLPQFQIHLSGETRD